jgi:hypothetical protein
MKYYAKKVRHRTFLPGDLVLRKVFEKTKEWAAGKLGPNWEGPYRARGAEADYLESMDGKKRQRPWNAINLKKDSQ